MDTEVVFSTDPAFVLEHAGAYLASEPVLHNLLLTLLHERVAHPEAGRYWMATEGGRVTEVVLQSPLSFPATLTPMSASAVEAVVDAIAAADVALPGVNGDAATSAAFAGCWSERTKSGATPFMGLRLYERLEPGQAPSAGGRLREADAGDRGLAIGWMRGFQDETGDPVYDIEVRVDRWIAAGEIWLWEDGEPVSMAVARRPVAGAVRISEVYTPPGGRRRGYAEACVYALSNRMRDAGLRCMLYTDLANPTSNSIYWRNGYRAVAEGIRYRFA